MTPDTRISLVIIDANTNSLELLSAALALEGLAIFTAADPEEGLEIVFREYPQIVLADLVMPGLSGLDVLERVVDFDPAIDVVLMTAHYSAESALDAISKGASGYLNKPVSIGGLRESVSRMIAEAQRRQRVSARENELLSHARFEDMAGRSAAMIGMFSRIRRVAPHFRSVLVTGETGVGKELAAKALHNLSPVSGGRFVVLNCSAVVETLFESELFGHVRGSFTGATQDKTGLFEYADRGTIFLDEIASMPLGTQAILLRAIENREVLRVGSETPRSVDVRVIAATDRDLRAAVADKLFREDLYYRLSMMEVRVPPLADRREDLPLLIRFFIGRFAAQFGKQIRGLTDRAHIVLARHTFPGNVRELENILSHACMMVQGTTIDVRDLPEYMRFRSPHPQAAVTIPDADTFDERETHLIAEALSRAGGNQSQAARALSIGRDALRYKMRKHGLL